MNQHCVSEHFLFPSLSKSFHETGTRRNLLNEGILECRPTRTFSLSARLTGLHCFYILGLIQRENWQYIFINILTCLVVRKKDKRERGGGAEVRERLKEKEIVSRGKYTVSLFCVS